MIAFTDRFDVRNGKVEPLPTDFSDPWSERDKRVGFLAIVAGLALGVACMEALVIIVYVFG